ncbi:hypothetical protein A3C96_04255 [Candidatus Uhrbacteria bacterium RIFCSPHIGHO2_02_FULL_60_10]|uniref:Methyltransferase type 12 domain-containing protein n=1 Tax=Candidatus Uhrbacteria bacterium RIFCSPHIGHO2_02_FULL_60_10 TaxID=1802392 RepID=A0A1F7U8Q0_9BACT|nr:MAG: hypothetical protein A3C96_04255 [Candidatus Uhrbacteria bacterium RIFCSPHIGHO2_02_FULL_60_10]
MTLVPERLHRVLEYGPGDGVITTRLLERLDSDGTLLAVEANPEFVRTLADIKDQRFKLVAGNATEAAKHAAASGLDWFDLVISGIPFSQLSRAQRREMTEMTYARLRPGGIFLVYQTTPLMVPHLKRRFAVRTSLELRNIPPYFIMQAVKK